MKITRQIAAAGSIMVALSPGLAAVSLNAGATATATPQSAQASAIATIVQKAMKTEHLRAVIVKVTQGDKVIISQAFGESMTGVPATTAMHFPNGAVAFAYVSTLLRRGSPPGAQIRSTSGLSRSDSSTRWAAPCSSLPGPTGATRTPTS